MGPRGQTEGEGASGGRQPGAAVADGQVADGTLRADRGRGGIRGETARAAVTGGQVANGTPRADRGRGGVRRRQPGAQSQAGR